MSGIFQKATGLLRPHILSTSFSLRSFVPAIPLSAAMPPTTPQNMAGQTRTFHSTPPAQKRVSGRKNPYAGRGGDPKLYIIRRWTPKRMSAPLRMGRNRYLRHWTIHRAWLLYQRNERARQQQELMRMQQGMSAALEELRQTSGPGTRDEGYLYRVATMKIGVWHMGAIPIEYARMQTETPARLAWNHDWKVSDQEDD